MRYVLGIDVGGTFTDAVAVGSTGAILSAKTPSTPDDYGDGVLTAVGMLADSLGVPTRDLLASTEYIAHGTTSSLNALVMGRVPDVGFLTTKGHRDAIYIMNVEGRYLGRPQHELQDVFSQQKPRELVPRKLAREVSERMDRDGNVVAPLDEQDARAAIADILAEGVPAIAISLLWSFRNPAHERRLRELVHEQDPNVFVTLSSEVSPRIREFARHSTTIMNTRIGPGLRHYLGGLDDRLRESGLAGTLLVMQSSGGAIAAREAPASAITTIGGVLTGGVVGCVHLASKLGHKNVVATDVGGTTFLAGLIVDGQPVRATEAIINQYPINVPTLQVEAIGSGGGAIAWIDRGGNLRVGPHSAQAAPGPACYGAGGMEPTNTDANLVLGILPETGLLGGLRPIRKDLAVEAIKRRIADPLGLTVEEAAAAIYAVQNAQTGDLLRKLVVENGHDPREFAVYAFGGAGPAHCAFYAAELGATEVIVPLGPVASAFSAFGLAVSDIVLTQEFSDPMSWPFDPAHAQGNFERLEGLVRDAMDRQQIKIGEVVIEREVDMRYGLQMREVTVPVVPGQLDAASIEDAVRAFERAYARLYGEASGYREAGVHAITFRVRGVGALKTNPSFEPLARAAGASPEEALVERRPVCLGADGYVPTPVYDYVRLRAGHEIVGPAVIQVPTTSVVVPAGTAGTIDALGNLHLKVGKAPR